MKKILLSAFAIFAMMACNNEEPVRLQEQSLITFEDSFVEAKTRAAEDSDPSITTGTIEAFDVWGFINQPSGLVFDAERVTKSEDGGWRYTNLQYWMPEKSYYFHAVAPVDDANIVVDKTNMDTKGLGTISFTNVDGTTDLIYASKHVPTGSDVINNAPAPVELKFMHLLSKIKFTFTNGFPNGNTSLKVTDIKITNAPAKGSIDVNKEREDFSWTLVQGETTELAFGNVNDAVASGKSNDCAFERLTIPADATRNYTIKFTLELFYGDQSAGKNDKVVTLENQEFAIGKNYNITAIINNENFYNEALKPIEFTVVEVENWENVEFNGNIHDGESTNPEQPEQPAEPEVLATPVVTRAVEGNVVTLTWDAVEGAKAYSVQVNDGEVETVEGTTYTFTGEYGVSYTFTIQALPTNEETHEASEAAEVTVEIPAQTPSEPEQPTYTSVADFLAASVDANVEYTLKGTITRVVNTSYGNFDLTDETGTVHIYGLNSPDGATKKYWATSGAKLGDDIVIKTVRADYNGSAQGANAKFVELLPGSLAFYTVDPAAIDFLSTGGQMDIEVFAYNTDAAVTATSDNDAFAVAVNGYVVTVTAKANELEEEVTGNISIKVGDLETTVVKATLAAKPAAGTVEGGKDDFDTKSANNSYTTGTTAAGWKYINCALLNKSTVSAITDSSIGVTMNGKTSAVGSIESPVITTGCGTLKFNYAHGYKETNGFDFDVQIIQNGETVQTFNVKNTSTTQNQMYTFEENINLSGEFSIKFINNSPSNNSSSNKDRYTIWDVEWTGYN